MRNLRERMNEEAKATPKKPATRKTTTNTKKTAPALATPEQLGALRTKITKMELEISSLNKRLEEAIGLLIETLTIVEKKP